MYQKTTLDSHTMIVRDDGNGLFSWIPTDPGNADYQAFLAWCAEGNEPEPWSPPTGETTTEE